MVAKPSNKQKQHSKRLVFSHANHNNVNDDGDHHHYNRKIATIPPTIELNILSRTHIK